MNINETIDFLEGQIEELEAIENPTDETLMTIECLNQELESAQWELYGEME
jgi:hypothetical protein